MRIRPALSLLLAVAALASLVGCGTVVPNVRAGTVFVVAAENEYGNVASQVGGRYVTVLSIESNPNTDPHDYEVSPSVALAVDRAQVLIQNGVGYDAFMNKLEAATSSAGRSVLDVQSLLGLADSTANPHLWYSPATMPAVAAALARDLAAAQPAHAAYFEANAQRFTASLHPWLAALAAFRARDAGTPVAVTEPVADYLLQAAGARILTPFRLQADIMNGVDPAPQDITAEEGLLAAHQVKVLLYNQQVTDTLTESFITAARRAGIPVVGVYETMPTGLSYQSWMLAETEALRRAVTARVSTVRL